jgi:hypothetical protein
LLRSATMAQNACVYLTRGELPTAKQLQDLADGASVVQRRASRWRRRMAGYDLNFARTRVAVNIMPAAEVPLHLEGFRAFLRSCSGAGEVLGRIDRVNHVLGMKISPGFDTEGQVEAFIQRLARWADGFWFDAQGTICVPADPPNATDEPVARGPATAPPSTPRPATAVADGQEPRFLRTAPTANHQDQVPPSPRRAARRALVLLASATRGELEHLEASAAAAERCRLVAWLETHKLLDELEPDEAHQLTAPVGALDPGLARACTWRFEAAAVLAWALQLVDLPPYHQQIDGALLAERLAFLRDELPPPLSHPELRSPHAIACLREHLFTVHWRLREWSLRGEPIDFRAVADRVTFGPLRLDDVQLHDGDLALRGVPIGKADDRVIAECLSIAHERHLAINWLIAGGRFSQTDNST